MLRMLLMPNCTEKPTAPRAITAPVATPKPTASMISCNSRPPTAREGAAPASPRVQLGPDCMNEALPQPSQQAEDLRSGDAAHPAGAAVRGEDIGGELTSGVVVLVEHHRAKDTDVLDLLAGL